MSDRGAGPAPHCRGVLEITSYPPPRAGWGVRVSFVRRELERRGVDCQVLNIGKSRRVRSPDYVDVQGGLDFLRKVRGYARRGYLVHTHINGDGNKGWALALAAAAIAWRCGCPRVLTFHAGPRQRMFPRERSRLAVPYFKLVFRLAQRIVCNSGEVADAIATYGVPREKVRAIQAFSRQYLHYEPTPLPAELERFLAASEPRLLVYFFLRPEFHIESFLDAVSTLAGEQERLGVVAAGLDAGSERFRRMLASRGLGPRVYPAGDLSHDAFMSLLSRVHFYVRTPEKDGVCSSVLEALALGVPVVASENGRRPAGVVRFRPDDAGSLADTLRTCWARYREVRAGVIPPEVPDTVAVEADLLLEMAQGPAAGVRREGAA